MAFLDQTLRWLVRQALSSYAFLCLWLLGRCFQRVPLFRMVPIAYALSAMCQLFSLAIVYGSLSRCVMATPHGWLQLLVLVLAGWVRVRLRGHGLAIFVGLFVLLPHPGLPWTVRTMLFLLNIGVAVLAWCELKLARRQYDFKPFMMSNINEGSATVLRGTIDVVHVFVHAKQGWELTARRSAHAAALRAMDWLITQAQRYKVRVRFRQHVLWKSYAQNVPEAKPKDPHSHQRFGRWLNKLLHRQLGPLAAASNANRLVVVHANQDLADCLAYAVPQHILRDTTAACEYAVVGFPHSPSIYAHEILHLFGADDFYLESYDRPEEPLREKLLARCIMFDGNRPDFSTALIDDLTAQNVGWL